jgi:hypothetical protein
MRLVCWFNVLRKEKIRIQTHRGRHCEEEVVICNPERGVRRYQSY